MMNPAETALLMSNILDASMGGSRPITSMNNHTAPQIDQQTPHAQTIQKTMLNANPKTP